MLDRLKEELQERAQKHDELVQMYEGKRSEIAKTENDLVAIEKEIIRNQGAMEAIDRLAYEIATTGSENVTEESVQIVEEVIE